MTSAKILQFVRPTRTKKCDACLSPFIPNDTLRSDVKGYCKYECGVTGQPDHVINCQRPRGDKTNA